MKAGNLEDVFVSDITGEIRKNNRKADELPEPDRLLTSTFQPGVS
jgi:hypothetical protein